MPLAPRPQAPTLDIKNLPALYDVHLWDVSIETLVDWASRIDALGSTRETRAHLVRIRNNISRRTVTQDSGRG